MVGPVLRSSGANFMHFCIPRFCRSWGDATAIMQVSYLPCNTISEAQPKECRAACNVCAPCLPSRDVGSAAAFMTSSRKSFAQDGWVHRQVDDPWALLIL